MSVKFEVSYQVSLSCDVAYQKDWHICIKFPWVSIPSYTYQQCDQQNGFF